MAPNLLPGENRNTLRLAWKRPIYIISPIKRLAQSINVSSSGILITTLDDEQFEVGGDISISIPHAITKVTTTVSGKIVRIVHHNNWIQIAIDLNT
jgi:hypothetical protein